MPDSLYFTLYRSSAKPAVTVPIFCTSPVVMFGGKATLNELITPGVRLITDLNSISGSILTLALLIVCGDSTKALVYSIIGFNATDIELIVLGDRFKELLNCMSGFKPTELELITLGDNSNAPLNNIVGFKDSLAIKFLGAVLVLVNLT